MRHHNLLAAALILLASSGQSVAAPFPPVSMSRADNAAPIVLVQAKKDETLQQKAKRVWRNIAGYKFDVNCPINNHRTCAETGKNRNDARAKCISRHPLCWVSDAK